MKKCVLFFVKLASLGYHISMLSQQILMKIHLFTNFGMIDLCRCCWNTKNCWYCVTSLKSWIKQIRNQITNSHSCKKRILSVNITSTVLPKSQSPTLPLSKARGIQLTLPRSRAPAVEKLSPIKVARYILWLIRGLTFLERRIYVVYVLRY